MKTVYIETSMIMHAFRINESRTMKDPIIQELWKTKDRIAKECGNNIDTLAKKPKEKEAAKRAVTLARSKKTIR